MYQHPHTSDFNGDSPNACNLSLAQLQRPPQLVSARKRRRELAAGSHSSVCPLDLAALIVDIPRADGQIEPYLIAPNTRTLLAILATVNDRLREQNPPSAVGRATSNTEMLVYPLEDSHLEAVDRRVLEQAYRRKGYKVSWRQVDRPLSKNKGWFLTLIW